MIRPTAWARSAMAGSILLFQLGAFPAPARAQSGQPPVQRGQEYYDQSRFDEAITLLRNLVDRGALSGDEMLRAREILARSYVKKGYPVQAREMFRAILDQNPAYRPDPIRVPPDEMAIFEQALRDYQGAQGGAPGPAPGTGAPAVPRESAPPPATSPSPPPQPMSVKEGGGKKKPWWIWAAAGAVAVGVAAAVGGGGGGGGGSPAPTPLPTFPSPPSP